MSFELDELVVRFKNIVDVAVNYKNMFHEMQQELWDQQDRYTKQTALLKRQREIIRKLEAQLDISDEL